MPKRTQVNRTIEVILLQTDKHLGEKYETVRVKPIFAKNVLLPKNIAVIATPANVNTYRQKMQAAEQERAKKVQGLEELFAKATQDGGITILRKANKDGSLYAKVDENDIVETIKDTYKISVDAHNFKMKKKLTTAGTYTVPFLYKDIKTEIIVNVEKEEEKKKNDEDKE